MSKDNIDENKPINSSFYIAPSLLKEAKKLAKEEERSVSAFICWLIKKAIKESKKQNIN